MTKKTLLAPPQPVLAIYTRYSSDRQNETSLEDQLRRCKEVAARNGMENFEVLEYQDAAITASIAADRRDGYMQMKADWIAGKFDVVIVDEYSRICREPVEDAKLVVLLERTHRMRLITGDGLDTNEPDWQLRLGLQGIVARQEINKLRYRVPRGMIGQLARGFMIAAPAFGYTLLPRSNEQAGAKWVIHEPNAEIVRQIFARRAAGDSMHQIAAWLNEQAVPCSRKARKSDGGHWRPSRIKTLLQNPIYRGVFVWHGSKKYEYDCAKSGKPIEKKEYPRPELRLVSDETWLACNSKTISRSGYGGGSHALTGLLTCGHCGGTLSLTSAAHRSRSAYCPACSERRSSKQENHLQTTTILIGAVQQLVSHAVKHFTSPTYLAAHRQVLQRLLEGDRSDEIEKAYAQLKKLEAAQQRLARMLAETDADDDVLEASYAETKGRVAEVREQITQLRDGAKAIDVAAIRAQLQVDLQPLAQQLFDSNEPPQALRARLARMLPLVVFEGKSKESRYISHFKIKFCLGHALSIASSTPLVSPCVLQARFKLQYKPGYGRGASRVLGCWSVETLHDLPGIDVTANMPAQTEKTLELLAN